MRLLRGVLVALLTVACSACLNDATTSDVETVDVGAVTATMDAASAALAARDVAGFMESWTDDGLQQVFYEFGDAFVANTGYHIGAGQYSLGAATAPSVHGDTATTVAPLFFRLVGVVREFTLVRVDLGWRIDGAALTTTDVPDADPVDVAFGESSMVFDSSTVTDGDIALQIHNPTTRRHQINILSAPPEQDLAAFFEHPEDAPPVPEGMSMPEGFDFVGGVVGIEPGASVTMVFSQALPAARYFMFCNSEDGAPGEPHSKRGEFLEFTIG